MKKLIVVLAFLCVMGCAGMTGQQKIDAGFQVAELVYGAAMTYFTMNQESMSPEDVVLFQKYLGGFELALDTGEETTAWVKRWNEFMGR
jgi:hypothetical protein